MRIMSVIKAQHVLFLHAYSSLNLIFTLNKGVYVSSSYSATQKGFEICVWTQCESLLSSKSKGHNIYFLSSNENILNARLLENQLVMGGG